MTNIDHAAEIMREADRKSATDPDINRYCYPAERAQALADAGLLMPDPQIIRTVAELDALDPDTILMSTQYQGKNRTLTRSAGGFRKKYRDRLPAVVITPADQVRAARKALEEA